MVTISKLKGKTRTLGESMSIYIQKSTRKRQWSKICVVRIFEASWTCEICHPAIQKFSICNHMHPIQDPLIV